MRNNLNIDNITFIMRHTWLHDILSNRYACNIKRHVRNIIILYLFEFTNMGIYDKSNLQYSAVDLRYYKNWFALAWLICRSNEHNASRELTRARILSLQSSALWYTK